MCVVNEINIFMLISDYLNDKKLKTIEMNAIEDSINFDLLKVEINIDIFFCLIKSVILVFIYIFK